MIPDTTRLRHILDAADKITAYGLFVSNEHIWAIADDDVPVLEPGANYHSGIFFGLFRPYEPENFIRITTTNRNFRVHKDKKSLKNPSIR